MFNFRITFRKSNDDNKSDSKDIVYEPDLVIDKYLYDDGVEVVKLLKFCPEDMLKYLFKEKIAFNPVRWSLSPSTLNILYERLSLSPFPRHTEIRDLIIQAEGRELFIDEGYMKNSRLYLIGKIVKDLTEQGYREQINKMEYLQRLNTALDKNDLERVSLFVNNVVGVIEPTKRMRRKGLERLEYYWQRFLVYQVQDTALIKELTLISGNISAKMQYQYIDENYTLSPLKTEIHDKSLTFNIGLGENILPKDIFPVLVNPDYACHLRP
ncbi:hypothetical protein [Persephonella sp.]